MSDKRVLDPTERATIRVVAGSMRKLLEQAGTSGMTITEFQKRARRERASDIPRRWWPAICLSARAKRCGNRYYSRQHAPPDSSAKVAVYKPKKPHQQGQEEIVVMSIEIDGGVLTQKIPGVTLGPGMKIGRIVLIITKEP